MHTLIQFRQLASALNKSELKHLFSTLIEDEFFDEQFIITSMFNQFHKDLCQSKQSPIQTINNSITNIINERDISVDDSSEYIYKSITFESLSSAIVNEIGSYLTIKEICNFEKTTRSNFISMRYPYPALYSIGFDDPYNADWLHAYSENQLFDFVQFKGVKKLALNVNKYHNLKHKFESLDLMFNKVENLCLHSICESNQLSFIIEQNVCNFTSLKHLSFNEIDIVSIDDANAFEKLLTNNKYLKSLEIKFSYSNEFVIELADPSIISHQLPNLTALSACANCPFEIYEQVADTLNHQIESLHIGNMSNENMQDVNILNSAKGYPNLKEFCIGSNLHAIEYAINQIMKKSKNIEQLNLVILCSSVLHGSITESNKLSVITQKIAQLSDLKLLQIYYQTIDKECCMGYILSGLNKFLMHHKRDIFKLIVKCLSEGYYDEPILNLILIMNTWITQFSFVFVCTKGFGLKEETINTLKQVVNVKCYERYKDDTIKYVISSNEEIYIPCIYACQSHPEFEATSSFVW